ncbi:MAG TPA: molybdopterin-binding protein, partial [Alphaproteobacteria bacterium]|nr:molybdopterin-binding protein [Alphaproteobacteria bacterium]
VTDLGILPDDRSAIREALEQAAAGCDVIVTSGGVSGGEEDHVKAALEAAGGKLHAWRLAIKPGRPVALGQLGSVPFLALPGNPVAVMVTFLMVARPILLALAGAAAEQPRRYPVIADFAYRKKPGRREYVRVLIRENNDGTLVAAKHPRDGAGVLSSMVEADGLVELADDLTVLTPGSTVSFLPFSGAA